MSHKTILCPKCGTQVKLPLAWIIGVELVFRCPQCKRPFKTGFRMGALLFGLALALSLGSANVIAYLFSSVTLPVVVLLVVPMWLLYGYLLRRSYLNFRTRRQHKRFLRNSEGAQHS